MNRPKNILKIQDLVFILPDNFNGDLRDAIVLLAAYLNIDSDEFSKRIENPPEFKSLFDEANMDNTLRLSMNYGIFELGDDEKYKIKK